MNHKILFAATCLALLGQGPLAGRTWTSADGSKTFEGVLRALNENAKTVTVLMTGDKLVTFAIGLLSDKDRTFLKEEGAKIILAGNTDKGVGETLQDQKIGKNLIKEGILSKIEGEAFAGYQLTKTPEYYIIYFSASW